MARGASRSTQDVAHTWLPRIVAGTSLGANLQAILGQTASTQHGCVANIGRPFSLTPSVRQIDQSTQPGQGVYRNTHHLLDAMMIQNLQGTCSPCSGLSVGIRHDRNMVNTHNYVPTPLWRTFLGALPRGPLLGAPSVCSCDRGLTKAPRFGGSDGCATAVEAHVLQQSINRSFVGA